MSASRSGGIALALVLVSWAVGCKAKMPKLPKLPFSKKPSGVSITIESQRNTNEGRSIHGLVRVVSDQEFVTDSYERMAGMAFANPADPTVLRSFVVLPGKTLRFRFEKEKEKPVAIYCLFTDPGDQWKILLAQPLKRGYAFVLERNTIQYK